MASTGTPPYPTLADDASEEESDHIEGEIYQKQGSIHRPQIIARKSSGTMIIPMTQSSTSQTPTEDYPPDDARSMSPRLEGEDMEKLEMAIRSVLQE